MKVIRKPECLDAVEWTGSTEAFEGIRGLVSKSDIDYKVYLRGDKIFLRDIFFGIEHEEIVSVGEFVVLEDGSILICDRMVFEYAFEKVGEK